MKNVNKVMIFNGALFDNERDAKRKLEAMHADKLSFIAGKLATLEKYTKIGDWIDANMHEFAALQQIKDDMKIEQEGEEE